MKMRLPAPGRDVARLRLCLTICLCSTFAVTAGADCVTAPAGVVSWWRGEGGGSDAAGGNPGIPLNGVTYGPGEVGQGFNFDGVDDRVIVSNAPSLNFGPGADFSVEAWIQPLAAVTDFGAQTIVDKRYTPNFTAAVGYAFGLGDGKLSCQLADAPLTPLDFSSFISPGPDLRDGQFHHVAMTVHRASTDGGKLYVDGQVVLTFDPTVQPGDLSTTEPLRIGAHADPALNSHFKGRIDELAIYNRALSASEVSGIYQAGAAGKCVDSNPPPPGCVTPAAGLVGWWRAETNVLDSAGDHNGTPGGGLVFSSGQVGQGFVFNGTNASVSVPAAASLDVGQGGGFSIECWINPAQIADAQPLVEWFQGAGPPWGVHFWISEAGSGTGPGCLYVNIPDSFGGEHKFSSAAGIVGTNAWQHVALTYDRATGDTKLFYNGTVVAARTLGFYKAQTSYPLYLGRRPPGTYKEVLFNGGMDEVSLYNHALGTNEIQAIYVAGSAGKCAPPPACVTPPSGLVSWWPGESNTTEIVGGSHGTAQGTLAFAPGEVGQALDFKGSLTGVVVAANSALNVGIADGFSIEAWINPSTIDLERPIVEWNAVTGGNPYPHGVHLWISVPVGYGGGPGCLYANLVDSAGSFRWLTSAGGLIKPHTWQHVALTYDKTSGLAFLYLDGVMVASKNVGIFTPQTSYDLFLGWRPAGVAAAYSWAGQMDEVSIYNRALSAAELQAIYTAGSAGKCRPFVGTPPEILAQPQDRTVNAGASASFSVSATGAPPLRYQWLFGGSPIAGATASSYVLNNAQPANAGKYSVAVSNLWGALTSSNATLTVLTYPPTITLHPSNVTVFQSTSAAFLAQATGTAPLSYQWFFNDTPVPGKTTTALVLANVQPSQAGNYWMRATNAYGSANSSNAVLTVLPPPPCVTVPEGAVAWWRAESNTWDSVGINDALVSGQSIGGLYMPGKVGTAFQLFGKQLVVPASEELDVGAGQGLTVEGWISAGSVVPFPQPVIEWNDRRGILGVGLVLNGTRLEASLSDTNTTPIRRVGLRSPNGAITKGWQHVALTFDKSSGLAILYLSGASVAQTNLGNFRPQTKASIYFPVPSSRLSMGLDEMTLYNRALSPAELQAIVAADLTGKCPPPPPACAPPPSDFIAWWRGESNALDHVDGNHGVITNTVIYTNGMVGKAFQFVTGQVRVPASSNLNVGAGPGFTIESWVLPQSSSGSPLINFRPLFAGWHSGNTSQGVSLHLAVVSPFFETFNLVWESNLVDTQGQSHVVRSPAGLAAFNVWQHVALSYDRAGGAATLYLNGNPVTRTNVGTFTPKTTSEFRFGALSPTASLPAGAMDEVSLYARALSDAEIRALMLSRGTGKCQAPPAIVTQPASLRANVGSDGQFSVGATGNPLLRYQWFKDGATLPGATDAALTLPAVHDVDAGTYAVRVTNWFGLAMSSNAVLAVNHPPEPRIVVSPLTRLPGLSNLVVIAPVCHDATVILDASQSGDVDNDSLQYAWAEGTNSLGTTAMVTNRFAPGSHTITLRVNDGSDSGTTTTTFAVLTPEEAVRGLAASLVEANLAPRHAAPLLATLHAAAEAFERCKPIVGILALKAFQHQVHAQIAPGNPGLADTLIKTSQDIIDIVAGAMPDRRCAAFHNATRWINGHLHMKFSAPNGRNYFVQASTDLKHWETIGVAQAQGDGDFLFEDPFAAQHAQRFYRIVSE